MSTVKRTVNTSLTSTVASIRRKSVSRPFSGIPLNVEDVAPIPPSTPKSSTGMSLKDRVFTSILISIVEKMSGKYTEQLHIPQSVLRDMKEHSETYGKTRFQSWVDSAQKVYLPQSTPTLSELTNLLTLALGDISLQNMRNFKEMYEEWTDKPYYDFLEATNPMMSMKKPLLESSSVEPFQNTPVKHTINDDFVPMSSYSQQRRPSVSRDPQFGHKNATFAHLPTPNKSSGLTKVTVFGYNASNRAEAIQLVKGNRKLIDTQYYANYTVLTFENVSDAQYVLTLQDFTLGNDYIIGVLPYVDAHGDVDTEANTKTHVLSAPPQLQPVSVSYDNTSSIFQPHIEYTKPWYVKTYEFLFNE